MSTYYACAPSDTTHVRTGVAQNRSLGVRGAGRGRLGRRACKQRERERKGEGGGKGEREEEGEVGGGRGRTRHVRTRNARRSSGHN